MNSRKRRKRQSKEQQNICPINLEGGVLEVFSSFSGSELINITIGVERRGIAFYDIITRSTGNAIARDVFQHLADMERQRIQIFQNLLEQYLRGEIKEGTLSIGQVVDYKIAEKLDQHNGFLLSSGSHTVHI